MKLNSEHLFKLATLEINALWRMQYFFCYCLNTTVCEFSNFNVDTVNGIQKKCAWPRETGEQFFFIYLFIYLIHYLQSNKIILWNY